MFKDHSNSKSALLAPVSPFGLKVEEVRFDDEMKRAVGRYQAKGGHGQSSGDEDDYIEDENIISFAQNTDSSYGSIVHNSSKNLKPGAPKKTKEKK